MIQVSNKASIGSMFYCSNINSFVHRPSKQSFFAGFPWMDQEGFHISAASFGIGAAPNCWLPLVNVADTTTNYDTAGLHRSRDPGAGAITPYHNRRGFATDEIPAG